MVRGKKGNIDTATEWEVRAVLKGKLLEKYKKIKGKLGAEQDAEILRTIINRYYELTDELDRI